MIVRYWGVRGSMAVPGPTTVRYGGNTPCVTVEADGSTIVIDAGSGIRLLGEKMGGKDGRIFVLVSHPHYDHVMGFPFFAPLFDTDRCVNVIDCDRDGTPWSLLELFDGVHVPVQPAHLPAACRRSSEEGDALLRDAGFEIVRVPLNHPGGSWGYRVSRGGRSFVHLTDNELDPPAGRRSTPEEIVDFCRGADVLSHDAQYVPSDMPVKRGWGHSTVPQVCDLARAAGVGHLVLFHHDPGRSDDAIDAIEADAKARLADAGIPCTAAYEGLAIEL
jgi:phosphoribosyl 1,2-cyclic phosphodiesterase